MHTRQKNPDLGAFDHHFVFPVYPVHRDCSKIAVEKGIYDLIS